MSIYIVHKHIMQTKTFILDAINRLTAQINIKQYFFFMASIRDFFQKQKNLTPDFWTIV